MKFRKTTLLVILATLLFHTGCKKENDPILEDPDERLNAYLQNAQQALTDVDYGYKVTLNTSEEKSYSLYMNFDEEGRVEMLSDFTDESATVPRSSSFRLKALQRPSLIFDTYNYISVFADPQGTVNGGVNGQGLRGDNDYSFLEIGKDSIRLRGNKNVSLLLLVKATQAEQEEFRTGSLLQSRQQVDVFLANQKNMFIEIGGSRVAVALNKTARTITLSKLEANGNTITDASGAFQYVTGGLHIPGQLQLGDITVQDLYWNESEKTYYVAVKGEQVKVQSSANPVFPLYLQFGYRNTYSTIATNTNALPAGVNSEFNQVWATLNANFASTNRTIRYMEFKLISEDVATLSVFYVSGTTNYVANMSFKYTFVNEVLTLSAATRDYSNANWTARLAQLRVLEDYILSGPFVLDWVSSASATETELMGGMARQSNSESFLYGYLKP